MPKKDVYLTVHGHFYQPPRENPWLEAIETQDSAAPFHDWNARINMECYDPNSVSKIVDDKNQVIDLVNNYSYMSYNFGPTLMSWLESNAPLTYERIIKADAKSVGEHNGHGNAMAQVYNHMIMPLANLADKYTQVIWGIRDFEYRYGRKPEGIWLAETAVDDETLLVLANEGIKFTVLSPYQADKFRDFGAKDWIDVSWGNIDPARPYRYFIKSAPEKYVDLFFYDGAISRSVAFDELLRDGNKFARRLQDGVSNQRNFTQLVNIATDGESYGHHTKFGDMALAYLLRVKAEQDGFTVTNYAEFLEKFPPKCEVEIKQASSWSCFHGVGRWKEDCGCSTGGHGGWNQKWRKPLRNALDYLRDELITLCETEGDKYFHDFWNARNKYIDVILDRNEFSIKKFFTENLRENLDEDAKVKAMKLMEIQRQAMLMYTSCGWFFAEISGIEPVQILKYAARAIQLAASFSDKDFETPFLNILAEAQSNIQGMGNGRDIYNKFVKPSVVTVKQMGCLWAVSSLYEDFEKDSTLYCYDFKKIAYKQLEKGQSRLVLGRIEVKSKITLETQDLTFALLQYTGGDFHCAIKEFVSVSEFEKMQKDLTDAYLNYPLTESIRKIDECFGREYFTLKDIFLDERRNIIKQIFQGELDKFKNVYRELYAEGRGSMRHLKNLNLSVPVEFKIAAQYTLSQDFNNLIEECENEINESSIQNAIEIKNEAKLLDVELDKDSANQVFTKKVIKEIFALSRNLEVHRAEAVLELFNYIEKLELAINIAEAQNIYFAKIYHELGVILESQKDNQDLRENRHFVLLLLQIGQKLNINTSFYRDILDKLSLPYVK